MVIIKTSGVRKKYLRIIKKRILFEEKYTESAMVKYFLKENVSLKKKGFKWLFVNDN